MSDPATTASTWTPDWARLHERVALSFSQTSDYLEEAVITEYQRQAAAAGLVMVPERALWTIFDKAREYYHFWREEDIADRDAIAAVLGVEPEPAPGGDGS